MNGLTNNNPRNFGAHQFSGGFSPNSGFNTSAMNGNAGIFAGAGVFAGAGMFGGGDSAMLSGGFGNGNAGFGPLGSPMGMGMMGMMGQNPIQGLMMQQMMQMLQPMMEMFGAMMQQMGMGQGMGQGDGCNHGCQGSNAIGQGGFGGVNNQQQNQPVQEGALKDQNGKALEVDEKSGLYKLKKGQEVTLPDGTTVSWNDEKGKGSTVRFEEGGSDNEKAGSSSSDKDKQLHAEFEGRDGNRHFKATFDYEEGGKSCNGGGQAGDDNSEKGYDFGDPHRRKINADGSETDIGDWKTKEMIRGVGEKGSNGEQWHMFEGAKSKNGEVEEVFLAPPGINPNEIADRLGRDSKDISYMDGNKDLGGLGDQSFSYDSNTGFGSQFGGNFGFQDFFASLMGGGYGDNGCGGSQDNGQMMAFFAMMMMSQQ
jgi:hypothetical protein